MLLFILSTAGLEFLLENNFFPNRKCLFIKPKHFTVKQQFRQKKNQVEGN